MTSLCCGERCRGSRVVVRTEEEREGGQVRQSVGEPAGERDTQAQCARQQELLGEALVLSAALAARAPAHGTRRRTQRVCVTSLSWSNMKLREGGCARRHTRQNGGGTRMTSTDAASKQRRAHDQRTPGSRTRQNARGGGRGRGGSEGANQPKSTATPSKHGGERTRTLRHTCVQKRRRKLGTEAKEQNKTHNVENGDEFGITQREARKR